MASTTTSALSISTSSSSREGPTHTCTSRPAVRRATWRARAAGISSGSTGETISTSTPLCVKMSAATQPSPPLLPKPTNTRTRSGLSFKISLAANSPANSMSSAFEVPSRSIISSRRTTSSVLKTGFIYAPSASCGSSSRCSDKADCCSCSSSSKTERASLNV